MRIWHTTHILEWHTTHICILLHHLRYTRPYLRLAPGPGPEEVPLTYCRGSRVTARGPCRTRGPRGSALSPPQRISFPLALACFPAGTAREKLGSRSLRTAHPQRAHTQARPDAEFAPAHHAPTRAAATPAWKPCGCGRWIFARVVHQLHTKCYRPCHNLKYTTDRVAIFKPCSFVPDWWVGTIPNRIASLIYINFD
jgi:hypothetical protein